MFAPTTRRLDEFLIFVLLALAIVLIAGQARGDPPADHRADDPAPIAIATAG